MKKNNQINIPISPEAILTLNDLKRRREKGEIIDAQTIEALNAIEIASKVINTIMSGNQIDPVFFKNLSDVTQNKIESLAEKPEEKKRVKKRGRFTKKRGA